MLANEQHITFYPHPLCLSLCSSLFLFFFTSPPRKLNFLSKVFTIQRAQCFTSSFLLLTYAFSLALTDDLAVNRGKQSHLLTIANTGKKHAPEHN